MALLDELLAVLTEKIEDAGKDIGGPITAETPLLSSGLITSLHLLELTTWIGERIDESFDLTDIDPIDAWDTPKDIVNFIERHGAKHAELGVVPVIGRASSFSVVLDRQTGEQLEIVDVDLYQLAIDKQAQPDR